MPSRLVDGSSTSPISLAKVANPNQTGRLLNREDFHYERGPPNRPGFVPQLAAALEDRADSLPVLLESDCSLIQTA